MESAALIPNLGDPRNFPTTSSALAGFSSNPAPPRENQSNFRQVNNLPGVEISSNPLIQFLNKIYLFFNFSVKSALIKQPVATLACLLAKDAKDSSAVTSRRTPDSFASTIISKQ